MQPQRRLTDVAYEEILSQIPPTRVSTLPNGFRVATEDSGLPTATVSIMGIHNEGAGLEDVYCTMGVEVDARSRRLSASTSTP